MGLEEIQQIVDIATKPKEKTENRKILVIIVCAMIPTVLIGVDLGNWHQWRNEIEHRTTRLEDAVFQKTASNNPVTKSINIK